MNAAEIKRHNAPRKLIENKIDFAGENSEISIYDTYESASKVHLNSGELLFCAMVTGRKIMHSPNIDKGQLFLPHESFVMAPGETVEIDFPEAKLDNPTTCLTVEISKEKVNQISERLNEKTARLEDVNQWSRGSPILHSRHSVETQRLLNRLTELFSENHPDRDIMIDLGITELVVRLLRHKTRDFLLNFSRDNPEENSLVAAIFWIENTLSEPLDIDQLCQHVGMSRSRLYLDFKDKMGCSPAELQQQLRLKIASQRILKGESITTISYDLGYNNLSHFCHRFKLFFGCSATIYRERYSKKN